MLRRWVWDTPNNVHLFPKLWQCRKTQYELVHQFKELGFPNIGFARSTAHALWQWFPLRQLQHSEQLESLCLPLARAKIKLPSKWLPHLSLSTDLTKGQKKSMDKKPHWNEQFTYQQTSTEWELSSNYLLPHPRSSLAKKASARQAWGSSSSLPDTTRRASVTNLH